MTFEEEEELLTQFIDVADGGHITDVAAIKAAYDKKIGHETGHGQIYYVLHRHGWTKKRRCPEASTRRVQTQRR